MKNVTPMELAAAKQEGFRSLGRGISDCPYTRTGLSPMTDRDLALADAWIAGLMEAEARAEDADERDMLERSEQQHNDLSQVPDPLAPPRGQRCNWAKVKQGVYVVRTQAGFKQAIKDFTDIEGIKPYSWPTKYPALITLSIGYNGGDYIVCHSMHFNELKAVLAKHD